MGYTQHMIEVRETDEYRRWFEDRGIALRGFASALESVESRSATTATSSRSATVLLSFASGSGLVIGATQRRDIERTRELARGL